MVLYGRRHISLSINLFFSAAVRTPDFLKGKFMKLTTNSLKSIILAFYYLDATNYSPATAPVSSAVKVAFQWS